MISEEGEQSKGTRTLLWAFAASALIHAFVLPFAFWSWAKNATLARQQQPREWVIASSAVRIERRPVPRPQAQPVRAQAPAKPAVVARAAAVAPRPAPRPAERHELARPAPTAPPQAPAHAPRPAQQSLEEQLAQQRQAFAQEVARLHASDNPLSIAPKSLQTPSTYQRTYFDVPGHNTKQREVQALLIPLRHWIVRTTMSCYYVRYYAQFQNGGNEEGVIPWPVCYPIANDAIAHPPYPHNVPIPVPQPDYVLPSGTYLTPLLQSIYNARER